MAPAGEPDPHKLVVGAGAITWAVAGAPMVSAWATDRVPQDDPARA